MPRIRSIKPEFWDDDVIGTLTRDARLLFIATWNLGDDEGRLRWTSAYLKSQAFMYDDDLGIDDVDKLMDELVAAGLVLPYLGGRNAQRLGLVVNFRRHQKPNRPQASKLPAPSREAMDRTSAEDGALDEDTSAEDGALADGVSGSVNDAVNDAVNDSSPEGRGGEGRGGGDARGAQRVNDASRPDDAGAPGSGPPRKCPAHQRTRSSAPCGACGDARREHDDWVRGQKPKPVPQPGTPRCPLHPQHPTGSKACPECTSEQAPAPNLRELRRATKSEAS